MNTHSDTREAAPSHTADDSELPDDFNKAYDLFSQKYPEDGAFQEKPNSDTMTIPLLNKKEQDAFTAFFEKVLRNPRGASAREEIYWLDPGLYMTQPGHGPVHLPALNNVRIPSQPSDPRAPRPQSQHEHIPGDGGALPSLQQIRKDSAVSGLQIQPAPQGVAHKQPSNPFRPPDKSKATQPPNSGSATFASNGAQDGRMGNGGPFNPYLVPKFNLDPQSIANSSEFYKGFAQIPTMVSNAQNVAAMAGAQTQAQRIMSRHVTSINESQLAENKATTQGKKRYVQDDSSSRDSSDARGYPRRRRDYLSEDQIRLNHINSEKRRRDLIKNLFTDLASLVPSISTDQAPKSLILQKVYAFMLETAEKNKKLRAFIEEQQVSTAQVASYKLDPPLPGRRDSSASQSFSEPEHTQTPHPQ